MEKTQSPTRDDGEGHRYRRTRASKIKLRRRTAAIPLLLCLVCPSGGVAPSSVDPASAHFEDDDNDDLDDPDCYDDRPHDCPGARHRGECWTMWESTMPACRSSCWLCVNATDLRIQGVTEDEIRRRKAFSRIDFGPLPGFPQGGDDDDPPPEVERTKFIVAAMDAYARQYPVESCTNSRAECPYWAALDQCKDNYEYMIQECPLACRYCNAATPYLDCQRHLIGKRRRKSLPASHVLQWKEWILTSTDFRSRNVLDNDDLSTSNDWAALIDTFVSPDELDNIRSHLIERMTFQPSDAAGYDLHDTLSLHAQTDPDIPQIVRRTSRSAFCDLSCIQQNPTLQSVLKRLMATLRVPSTAYLEKPIEFVSYGPVDTFARHSDCRVHDRWKMGGYRAATAYVALHGSDTTVGFPHVWDMVPVKAGQLLVWPNVQVDYAEAASEVVDRSSSQRQNAAGVQCNANMTTEVLASPGTSYGMLVHVRMHPMDESVPSACR